jgi:hypothetical protein
VLCCAQGLSAILFALPGAAAAQGFTLPKECAQIGASGAEGDDPVALVVDNNAKRYLITPVTVVGNTSPIEWQTSISPFVGGLTGYSIFVTYTPFLTSDVFVRDSGSWGSYAVTLPQPGVTGGRQTAIFPTFKLLIRDQAQQNPVPYAMVDFIPDFAGSSPLTIQADQNGYVMLYCVQQNFQGYNITINDSAGKYLYDGSFKATGNNLASAKAASVSTASPSGVTLSSSAPSNPALRGVAPPNTTPGAPPAGGRPASPAAPK